MQSTIHEELVDYFKKLTPIYLTEDKLNMSVQL